MKQRPSFPARLDSTLAKTRPNPHGAVALPVTALSPPSAPMGRGLARNQVGPAAVPVPQGLSLIHI